MPAGIIVQLVTGTDDDPVAMGVLVRRQRRGREHWVAAYYVGRPWGLGQLGPFGEFCAQLVERYQLGDYGERDRFEVVWTPVSFDVPDHVPAEWARA